MWCIVSDSAKSLYSILSSESQASINQLETVCFSVLRSNPFFSFDKHNLIRRKKIQKKQPWPFLYSQMKFCHLHADMLIAWWIIPSHINKYYYEITWLDILKSSTTIGRHNDTRLVWSRITSWSCCVHIPRAFSFRTEIQGYFNKVCWLSDTCMMVCS